MVKLDSKWIDHNGKGPPALPPKTFVYVRFRDGRGEHWSEEPFEFWSPDEDDPHDYWTWDGSDNDIVAYAALTSGKE